MQETRYHTGALLGRGGMAEVYAGIDRHLGRPVAIKRLREDRSANPTLRERFRREASAAASLNHPGIVAVLDTAEIEPSTGAMPIPIIVMELVDGCSLAETLRDGTRFASDRALEITADILDALAASHTAGIIHRDIKPANVLVTSDRPRQDRRLRHRAVDLGRVGHRDPDRDGDGFASLHVTGTSQGSVRRPPQRSLLGGLPAL